MSRPFPLLFALAFLLGLASSARAQQSGLDFLEIGPDAAGLALGDAGIAVVEGPFASERNPAALAEGSGTTLSLTHHAWITDVRTVGAAARFDLGARTGLGLYVRATGTGDIEARDQPGEPDGFFDAQFVAAGLAVGRKLGPVEAGAAVKLLSERIFGFSATGVAADIGLRARPADGIRLAAVYQHAGSMDALDQVRSRLPRTLRGAVAVYPFRVLTEDDGAILAEAFVTVEVSRNIPEERTQWHLAASAHVLDTVQARLGYLTEDDLRGVSFGVGVGLSHFQVDYALLPFEQGFGGAGHIFTLSYHL